MLMRASRVSRVWSSSGCFCTLLEGYTPERSVFVVSNSCYPRATCISSKMASRDPSISKTADDHSVEVSDDFLHPCPICLDCTCCILRRCGWSSRSRWGWSLSVMEFGSARSDYTNNWLIIFNTDPGGSFPMFHLHGKAERRASLSTLQ